MPKETIVIPAKVYDELRKQISFNRIVTMFCVIGTIYILKTEKRIKALEVQKGE